MCNKEFEKHFDFEKHGETVQRPRLICSQSHWEKM